MCGGNARERYCFEDFGVYGVRLSNTVHASRREVRSDGFDLSEWSPVNARPADCTSCTRMAFCL